MEREMRAAGIVMCCYAAMVITTGASARASSPVGSTLRVDVNRLPITDYQLKEFPFFTWPEEFKPQNTPINQEIGHFFFWDGQKLNEVEGRTFLVTLMRADGGVFNEYLIKKTIHEQLKSEGAVLLTSSKIPSAIISTISEVDREGIGQGLGDVYNDPVETWIIKRARYTIWIHYTDNSAEASLAVVASANPE